MLYTLRNSREYRRVYDQGKKYPTPFFTVFIRKSESSDYRYGITVTRKVGNAVVRNRCKRRMKEVVRRYFLMDNSERRPKIGFDLVINVKSQTLAAQFKDLEDSFSRVVAKYVEFMALRDAQEDPR